MTDDVSDYDRDMLWAAGEEAKAEREEPVYDFTKLAEELVRKLDAEDYGEDGAEKEWTYLPMRSLIPELAAALEAAYAQGVEDSAKVALACQEDAAKHDAVACSIVLENCFRKIRALKGEK